MTEFHLKKKSYLNVKGNFKLIGIEGNEIETGNEVSLCQCEQTKNKPLCDDTHKISENSLI